MDKVPVSPKFAKSAWIDDAIYEILYPHSINNPEDFWGQMGRTLDWIKPYTKVKSGDFTGTVRTKWFEDGKLNASENCIDRHLDERGDQVALIWEPDDPSDEAIKVTYKELHEKVCTFANVLKHHGVKKGDRIVIYLPMIPEAAYAMLACTRIGAVHSVVFGGFAAPALRDRILDSGAKIVITADKGMRGGRSVPLKSNTDEALADVCPNVKKVIVVKHPNAKDTDSPVAWNEDRDLWLHEEMVGISKDCPVQKMNAEDPLFTLYTSGSTGKPKGVVHTTGGYLLYASLTHRWVFDYHDKEIYWCTADIGWVTGHSYIVYGPLANGATTVMFEGIPNYPDHSRFWQIVDKHKVNIFYTAPTAIRALMREGDAFVTATSRKSLRVLGSVGEPINPEAWDWYHKVVGNGCCPVVDTWWQTETGGHMIAPFAGAMPLKPGSAMRPFFGVKPIIVDNEGKTLEGACEGILCLDGSWPGMMRTLWKNHRRFKKAYFSTYKGLYFTGDGCHRDADGDIWISGRIDDIINVSGHRMSTEEIESACVSHKAVAEAAVVGCPDDIKGQGIYVFVVLKREHFGNDEMRRALVGHIREELGPIYKPDYIQFVDGLPKTRSGKIRRRDLRKIVHGEEKELGDTSTLADPTVIEALVKGRLNIKSPATEEPKAALPEATKLKAATPKTPKKSRTSAKLALTPR